MQKKISSFITVAGLGFAALVSMGSKACTETRENCTTTDTQVCTEPREYCNESYDDPADQKDCVEYCPTHKGLVDNADLIKACQFGQLRFLSKNRSSAEEAFLDCDRHFSTYSLEFEAACRWGASEESMRRKGYGTAGERENGR